jgi:DNA modification methylase
VTVTILSGDCRAILPTLPPDSFDCVITSPPYWGLRDYQVDGQIGLEQTMQAYLDTMVDVCRDLRRVLKPEGTFWLNIGDSYATAGGGGLQGKNGNRANRAFTAVGSSQKGVPEGLKPKDLCLIPNRLAILLQEDGWYVRSEIIWAKPNPMPESVKDRPTCAHEKVWLLTKGERYYYDADAIREPPSAALIKQVEDGYNGLDTKDYASGGAQSASGTKQRIIAKAREKIDKQRGHGRRHQGFNERWDKLSKDEKISLGANARNVWQISPEPYRGAHFATMPPALAERCIKAGCPVGGAVLDPFGGAGTTGLVADRLGRHSTLIELNPAYRDLAAARVDNDAPLFAGAHK